MGETPRLIDLTIGEKHRLMVKLTRHAGREIEDRLRDGPHIFADIVAFSGIIAPRLTNIKDYERYRRLISEEQLLKLIHCGVISYKAMINSPRLSPRERSYVRKMLHQEENLPTLKEGVAAVALLGGDPVEILYDWCEEKRKRIEEEQVSIHP